MHLQKNMSYVRVEHFVPSRERAVRRVRLRSWSGLQTRSFTYHRTWDVSLLAFRARRDGFARARRVLRRLLFYAIFQFTLSAFQGLMAERPDDMMHGGVFDREPRHCVARVATSGGCLAASSGRHASGRPGESSARARRCCCATATRVRSWSSARQDETVRRTVRGERPFIMSFAAPPPSSSAPKAHAHPPVSPATERDTAAEASADARGVLKVRPHPPRPHRSPTRHPIIVGKEKNARPSGRHTPPGAFRLTTLPDS